MAKNNELFYSIKNPMSFSTFAYAFVWFSLFQFFYGFDYLEILSVSFQTLFPKTIYAIIFKNNILFWLSLSIY